MEEGAEGRVRHGAQSSRPEAVVVVRENIMNLQFKSKAHRTQFPGASVEREVEARIVVHVKGQAPSTSSIRQRSLRSVVQLVVAT